MEAISIRKYGSMLVMVTGPFPVGAFAFNLSSLDASSGQGLDLLPVSPFQINSYAAIGRESTALLVLPPEGEPKAVSCCVL